MVRHGIEKIPFPKQQEQPLPSLLSPSISMVVNFIITSSLVVESEETKGKVRTRLNVVYKVSGQRAYGMQILD